MIEHSASPLVMELFFRGFGLSASLIVAIGAQNAFVLRQGLKREHVFAVALTCALLDTLFIFLGVGGVGAFLSEVPALTRYLTLLGCAFLVVYGGLSFSRALRPRHMMIQGLRDNSRSLREVIIAGIGFSVLNPHVYLDTIVLIGGLASRYPADDRRIFALGAATASFVWFFALAYGAALLAPVFRKDSAWRVLDVAIGCIMILIVVSIARG